MTWVIYVEEMSTVMGRGFGGGYNMMTGYGGYAWFAGLMMFLFGALVIAGVVLLIVWAVRASGGHGAQGGQVPPVGNGGHDEAVAIARRRLAAGEITAEQYEEIIRALDG